MKELLNYVDIILIGLVVLFLFFTLRRVLGKDVGFKRSDKLEINPTNPTISSSPLGLKNAQSKGQEETYEEEYPAGSLAYKLSVIAKKDKSFTKKGFINSSKKAFELIVNSFASGDISKIEPFVSYKIYNAFANSITERNNQNKKLFVEIKDFLIADIYEVDSDDQDNVNIKMKFVTRQNRELYEVNQDPKDFSRNKPKDIFELWTFNKNLKDNVSIWKLVKTANA
ncbi:Tim44 domain-containing protein [Candidatus Hepatincolaceae symbiont of Richtersius coronifer]